MVGEGTVRPWSQIRRIVRMDHMRLTVRVYGGVPFFGTMERSVHWSIHPNFDHGPLMTKPSASREGSAVTLVQVVLLEEGMTVYIA